MSSLMSLSESSLLLFFANDVTGEGLINWTATPVTLFYVVFVLLLYAHFDKNNRIIQFVKNTMLGTLIGVYMINVSLVYMDDEFDLLIKERGAKAVFSRLFLFFVQLFCYGYLMLYN